MRRISNHQNNPQWSQHAWLRHQTETFSALLAICVGNSPVPGEFPAQRPVTRGCDFFFDLHLNREAGDLRRYCAHYDVIVMDLHEPVQTRIRFSVHVLGLCVTRFDYTEALILLALLEVK